MSFFLLLTTTGLVTVAQQGAPPPPRRPGILWKGVTQLPNGWRIAPAGRHMPIGDLPLNMVWSPDGRYLIVTNNGWSKPTLTVFDTTNWYVRSIVPVEHAWLGLAWHPDGKRLFSSGAAQNVVNEFGWNGESLNQQSQLKLGEPVLRPTFDTLENSGFIGGIAMSPDGRRLYAVHVLGRAISLIDPDTRRVSRSARLATEPYSALASTDGKTLFVSLWGGAKVQSFDAVSLEPRGEVTVGEHPNAMVQSKDGSRLFVACANTNAVWVIDLASGLAAEQIGVALFPKAPPGTTPNALALSPDGRTLLVANADNNTVAVVDVSVPSASRVRGFIPTGWYPTGVTFDREGKRIFVLSGKGLAPSANPRGPQPGTRGAEGQYIGGLLQGALSEIDLPDDAALAAHTARAYEVTPYDDKTRLAPAGAPADSPIPARVGDPSPIKHVFYIIRENRTYDQVLGDIPEGNGDPTLTLFGENVTPNAHALVKQFVLLDNFYVDAEVSYDGHAFSTGAYATDVVEKIWPTNYGQRGGIYLSEGRGPQRNPYGNLSAPPQGYIWDMANRAGVSVRSYGEFVYRDAKTGRNMTGVPGLQGRFHPAYPPYDLDIADNVRVDVWLREFQEFERTGELPRLNILRLGNDHTSGTRPGSWTPRAMVAENDLALGRVVEAVSRSRFWSTSAIFVLEDDAQNGPDHVDAHRAPALVISPFVKRGTVDSTLYTTSGMLRTIELILGLEPMSQYDAAATPMYNAFQKEAVTTTYRGLPARVPVDQRNASTAWGAEASMRMNLREADLAPELELNEIIWRSIRGANSPMPPPRRAAFIVVREEEDEAEKDEAPRPQPRKTPR
ncbi:MAG: bifunctional YncE family protein/alkaline phosphatase family protein [Vicinamibacterales bacterium]